MKGDRRYFGLWLASAMLGINMGSFASGLFLGSSLFSLIWSAVWMVVWKDTVQCEVRRLDDS